MLDPDTCLDPVLPAKVPDTDCVVFSIVSVLSKAAKLP